MWTFLEIIGTGVAAVKLHPLRSAVTVFCLCAVLVPYAAATALSNGIQWEAQISIDAGADLYVSGLQFGRQVPLPLSASTSIEAIDGVVSVVPRIVGEVLLGKDHIPAVLVGLPAAELPASLAIIEGRLPEPAAVHELVIGTELAHRLQLQVGSYIPPFYNSRAGDRVSKVVGIFRGHAPFWQSNLIFTTLQAAGAIFNQPQLATEFLVRCRPQYAARLQEHILRNVHPRSESAVEPLRLRVITREDMRSFLPRGLMRREGIFQLHYLLLIVASMLVVLVTSGFGLAERSREIGILKATGWQTDEVLLRSFAESLAIAMSGALTSLLLAFIWLRFLNGVGIASLFISGVAIWPTATIPYVLLARPAVITCVLAVTITMTGSLYSTWRTAVSSPSSVMRS